MRRNLETFYHSHSILKSRNTCVKVEQPVLFSFSMISQTALQIHAGVDDFGRGAFVDSKTTGHAGGRIACCLIVHLCKFILSSHCLHYAFIRSSHCVLWEQLKRLGVNQDGLGHRKGIRHVLLYLNDRNSMFFVLLSEFTACRRETSVDGT